MYMVTKEDKTDPRRRWALPDRIFFACGACHVLAFAFMRRYPDAGFSAMWIRPRSGFTGNHIVAVAGDIAFDYHGYSSWKALKTHHVRKANRWWPGWACDIVELPPKVLVSEALSRTHPGLWLRQPDQFLHNALPRADAFIDRYSSPLQSAQRTGLPQP